MLRGRKESVGEAIEKLQAMRKKAKSESEKYTEMYITETIKEAQSTVKRLSDRLNTLQANERSTEDGTILKLVDEMFEILFESHKNLDKVENNYSFWTDLDQKFNS